MNSPTPITLYMNGRSYFHAAQLIVLSPEYPPRATAQLLPIHALLSFSIELLLKGYLASSGLSDASLRGPIRHDLQLLLAEALKQGMPEVDGLGELVGLLGPEHKVHAFRYVPEDYVFQTMNNDIAFQVLNRLDDALRVAIPAVANYILSPPPVDHSS